MSLDLIYEQQFHTSKFRRDLETGVYSQKQLLHLIESHQLNEYQLQVVQELHPMIGGAMNVAKQGWQGAKNLAGGLAGKAKNAYNTGVQNTQQANQQKNQAQMWKKFDQSVTNAKILEQLGAFAKNFPQDKYIQQAAQYTNKVLVDLQNYLAGQYPYLNIQTEQQPALQQQQQPAQQQQQQLRPH